MQIFQALRLENKIVDCDGLKVIDLEKLIIADHPYWKEEHSWFSDIENLPFWSVEFLRKKFLNITNKKKFRNKIFIDRSDSTSPYNQIHNNAHEVKDNLLKKLGFEILKFSNLNFEDQVIRIYKNANVIIGAHGFCGICKCCFL